MKAVEEIRKELRTVVKFAYSLPQEAVERYKRDKMAKQKIFFVAKSYDNHIKNATPTLQKIYKLLYVEGLTQKDAANYLYYSEKYVQRLNKQLILFFQQAFK